MESASDPFVRVQWTPAAGSERGSLGYRFWFAKAALFDLEVDEELVSGRFCARLMAKGHALKPLAEIGPFDDLQTAQQAIVRRALRFVFDGLLYSDDLVDRSWMRVQLLQALLLAYEQELIENNAGVVELQIEKPSRRPQLEVKAELQATRNMFKVVVRRVYASQRRARGGK